jgi:hypothetical protein
MGSILAKPVYRKINLYMNEVDYTKEQLLATVAELNQRLLEFESKRGDVKWLETSLKSRTRDLSERMKEVECIHALLQMSVKQDSPFEHGAEKMIRTIREGWQYPEVTSVRIKWDDKEYQSLDFSTVRSKQSEPIMVSGKRRGELEVGYTMEKPTIWQGPFLKEEAKLLRSIALWLSLVIEKIDSN